MNKAINHVFTFQNSFTYLRSLTTAVYQCPMHSLIIIQSLISSKKHREQIKRGEIFVPFNSYFLPIIECYGYETEEIGYAISTLLITLFLVLHDQRLKYFMMLV